MKLLDRLYFLQGECCFFCKQPLPKNEASVEHLLAQTHGGGNSEDNCVVCCKVLNQTLGHMSLKEKFQVVLNQKGRFKCPKIAADAEAPVEPSPENLEPTKFDLVLARLANFKKSKPARLTTLTSTIASFNVASELEIPGLVQELQSRGKIQVDGKKVTYSF